MPKPKVFTHVMVDDRWSSIPYLTTDPQRYTRDVVKRLGKTWEGMVGGFVHVTDPASPIASEIVEAVESGEDVIHIRFATTGKIAAEGCMATSYPWRIVRKGDEVIGITPL